MGEQNIPIKENGQYLLFTLPMHYEELKKENPELAEIAKDVKHFHGRSGSSSLYPKQAVATFRQSTKDGYGGIVLQIVQEIERTHYWDWCTVPGYDSKTVLVDLLMQEFGENSLDSSLDMSSIPEPSQPRGPQIYKEG